MNQLHLTIILPKNNNNRNMNEAILIEKITLNYKFLPTKISQVTITIKENRYGEALLEINGTKVRAFCLTKILENSKSGVTQTISARDEVAEVLLHIVGSDYLIKRKGVRSVRWLTKLQHKKAMRVVEKLFDG